MPPPAHPGLSADPDDAAAAVPVHLVAAADWPGFVDRLDGTAGAFVRAIGFEPKAGRQALLPDASGQLAAVLFCAGPADPFAPAALASTLPAGPYRFAGPLADPDATLLGWLLDGYRFSRYRERPQPAARLVPPDGADAADALRIARAVANGRDLVNTPACDLGPDELEAAIRALGARYGASVSAIVGDDLLGQGLPMIHAVGRASDRAPRLVDLRWGEPDAPRVTVVGKGVCFDTGGLDIKPSAAMLLMKKDMGGAAAALALADMVMAAGLPLRLRLLVPAVDNAISGSAFRPGDVLRSRRGSTVEIGNTDAEGRLVLADALALADEEAPELLVDLATLTGAARVALGPDLPPFYTADEGLAADLARIAAAVHDPVWRLPLWPPYRKMLDSKVADLTNAPAGGMAGSITAALFLDRFVNRAGAHLHLDVYAWNPAARPGRPEGGEVQGARAVYGLLKERYGRARAG